MISLENFLIGFVTGLMLVLIFLYYQRKDVVWKITNRKIMKVLCAYFECSKHELYFTRETDNLLIVVFNHNSYYVVLSNYKPLSVVSCLAVNETY